MQRHFQNKLELGARLWRRVAMGPKYKLEPGLVPKVFISYSWTARAQVASGEIKVNVAKELAVAKKKKEKAAAATAIAALSPSVRDFFNPKLSDGPVPAKQRQHDAQAAPPAPKKSKSTSSYPSVASFFSK